MVRLICKIVALLTLVVLVISSGMYFTDKISLEQTKDIMLIVTIVWFVTASIWMSKSDVI